MVLIPIGVAVAAFVVLSGGPTETLESLNEVARVIAQQGMQLILGLR